MLASSALTPSLLTALVLMQVQRVTGNPHNLLYGLSYDQVSVTTAYNLWTPRGSEGYWTIKKV